MKDSEGKPRYYRGRGGSGRGRLRKIASHGKLVDRYARTARNCTCGPGRFARWNVDSIPDHHRVHFHCCRGHNSELLLPLPSRFRLDPVFSDLPLPLSLHRSRYSCTSVTTYRSTRYPILFAPTRSVNFLPPIKLIPRINVSYSVIFSASFRVSKENLSPTLCKIRDFVLKR